MDWDKKTFKDFIKRQREYKKDGVISEYGEGVLYALERCENLILFRVGIELPNIYEGTFNNDRIKIIRTLADNYNINIDTIRSLFNDGADFYKQTLKSNGN